MLISSPSEVQVGEPGHTLFPEFEVKNATNWPYKNGISISLDDEFDFAKLPIVAVK